jgi:hypothetical protein
MLYKIKGRVTRKEHRKILVSVSGGELEYMIYSHCGEVGSDVVLYIEEVDDFPLGFESLKQFEHFRALRRYGKVYPLKLLDAISYLDEEELMEIYKGLEDCAPGSGGGPLWNMITNKLAGTQCDRSWLLNA